MLIVTSGWWFSVHLEARLVGQDQPPGDRSPGGAPGKRGCPFPRITAAPAPARGPCAS